MDYESLRQMIEEAPVKGYAIINKTAKGVIFNRKSIALVILISLISIPALYWSLNLAGVSPTNTSYVGGEIKSDIITVEFAIPEVISSETDYTFYGTAENLGDREVEFEIVFNLGNKQKETGFISAPPGTPVPLNFTFTAEELADIEETYLGESVYTSMELRLESETTADLDIFSELNNIDFSDINSYEDIMNQYQQSQGESPFDPGIIFTRDTWWDGEVEFVPYNYMLIMSGLGGYGLTDTMDLYETDDGLSVELVGPNLFNTSRDENVTVRLTGADNLNSSSPSYYLNLYADGKFVASDRVTLVNETENFTLTVPRDSVDQGFDKDVLLRVSPAASRSTYWEMNYTAAFLGADYYKPELASNVSAGTEQRLVGNVDVRWNTVSYVGSPKIDFNYDNLDESTKNLEVTFNTSRGTATTFHELNKGSTYPEYLLDPDLYVEGESFELNISAQWGDGNTYVLPPLDITVLNRTQYVSYYETYIHGSLGIFGIDLRDVFVPVTVASVDVPEEITARENYEFECMIENAGEVNKSYVLAIILQNETVMTNPIEVASNKTVEFSIEFETGNLERKFDEDVALLLISFEGELFAMGSIDDILQDPDNSVKVEGYSVYKTDVFERGLVEQQAVDNFLDVFSGFIVSMAMFVCLIFGSAMFGQELDSKTMNLLVTQPISKLEMVVYKYIGFLIAIPPLMFIPTALVYTGFSVAESGLFINNLGLLGIAFFMLFLVAASLGAVFIMLGCASKHPIFLGLTYMMVWEVFFSRIEFFIQKYTLSHHIRSIIYPFMKDYSKDAASKLSLESFSGNVLATSQSTSLMVIPTVIIIVLGINVLILQNRDYS